MVWNQLPLPNENSTAGLVVLLAESKVQMSRHSRTTIKPISNQMLPCQVPVTNNYKIYTNTFYFLQFYSTASQKKPGTKAHRIFSNSA